MPPPVEDAEFALPIGSVVCPYCATAVTLNRNALGMMEELWMHEYECPGIVLIGELAA